MSQDAWSDVDRYIGTMLLGEDEVLDATLRDSDAAGLPSISVSAAQGKLLHVLTMAMGARRILELGTLGGYSAIWLARALPPDGTLVTLELEAKHADVARRNLARAGLAERIDLRVGRALDLLPRLAAEGAAPFDLVFIDADKGSYTEYLDWAIRLSRPGTLIIADNVIRKGAVADPGSDDPNVAGIRRFLAAVAAEPRVTATAIQTVGTKGHDGLAFIVVLP